MPLNFDIRRDEHAISEFTATIRFPQAINLTTFEAVTEALKSVSGNDALNLPAPMNMQVFRFAFGNAPPPPAAGTGRQRFSENGEVACSIWCELEAVTFTLREYTGWNEVLPTLVTGLSPLLRAYAKQLPVVQSISVQYLNEFFAKADGTTSTAEIFRPDSRWLSPFAYESEEPWHCHVGQFISSEEDFRNLININFDISPNNQNENETGGIIAKVLLMASCNYDLPSKGPLLIKSEDLENQLKEALDSAHSLEKKLLREVISDNYLKIIGDKNR